MRLAINSALAAISAIFLITISAAEASDNLTIERLATCQDSWVDWKENNPGMLDQLVLFPLWVYAQRK